MAARFPRFLRHSAVSRFQPRQRGGEGKTEALAHPPHPSGRILLFTNRPKGDHAEKLANLFCADTIALTQGVFQPHLEKIDCPAGDSKNATKALACGFIAP